MIRYIKAKQILTPMSRPESWFGVGYNMNLYRGCQHGCIYCDSRSACYGVDRFDKDIEIKENAIERLHMELASKRGRRMIGTGAMCDPYTPLEKDIHLTRRAVACIAERGFPLHIMTKSDLIVRDMDLLTRGMARNAVTFTVTTPDDDLAAKIEPAAPSPSRRFAAMKALHAAGVITGVAVMPVLPFIEDDEKALLAILEKTKEAGGAYAVVWLGVTLRDRQRVHFYAELDKHFPGMRNRYQETYGDQYGCGVSGADQIYGVLERSCSDLDLAWGMAGAIARIHPHREQVSLFDGGF
jgi:DNA repair photolyase